MAPGGSKMWGSGFMNNTQDNDRLIRINGKWTKYHGTLPGSVTRHVDVVDIHIDADDPASIQHATDTVGFKFTPFGGKDKEPVAIMQCITANPGKMYEDYKPTSDKDFMKITMERYFSDEAYTFGQLSRCKDTRRGGYGYQFAEFTRLLNRAKQDPNPMPGLVGVVCWRYVEGKSGLKLHVDKQSKTSGNGKVLVRLARAKDSHGFLAEGVEAVAKKGTVYNVIMHGSWFISGEYAHFARVHGVPNQCTGDVVTVMASFNNQQEHAVLAKQFIDAFLKDDEEARRKFPTIYTNSEWEMDPAPEYAREVVGRSGGFNADQTAMGCIIASLRPGLEEMTRALGVDKSTEVLNLL